MFIPSIRAVSRTLSSCARPSPAAGNTCFASVLISPATIGMHPAPTEGGVGARLPGEHPGKSQ